ncbi:MAG: hypothetical protein AAF705_14910, partial [Bacteroidota bacterium]
VFEILDMLCCTFDRNQVGMFVWAKIPERYKDAFEMSDEILYKANVFMTPGGIFGSQGNGYIRIALCSSGEIYEEVVRRLEEKIVIKQPEKIEE